MRLFLIALREFAGCALIVSLALSFPEAGTLRRHFCGLLAGVLLAVATGLLLGLSSYGDAQVLALLRYAVEASVFYAGFALTASRPALSLSAASAPSPLAWAFFGFSVFFFEARSIGFLTKDAAVQNGMTTSALSLLAGAIIGVSLIYPVKRFIGRLSPERLMSIPGLLILAGALKFALGGVSEAEEAGLLVALQKGMVPFLEGLVGQVQSALMFTDYPLTHAPFSGLAGFLTSDRTAMAIMVAFAMTPPLFMLLRLFAMADPVAERSGTRAETRLEVMFFRKEVVLKAIPALAAFLAILISIHTANLALNPLYDPAPMPVKAASGADSAAGGADSIAIPIADNFGDLTDGKLRKYIYYYGDKQIFFLAVMKPDGTLGVALDECEICRPADWNKSAKGYAQGGGNLVCKYCMTPIATSTVNNPGGCNPIPLKFMVEGRKIIITLEDLIRTYKAAQALEKKGTHL